MPNITFHRSSIWNWSLLCLIILSSFVFTVSSKTVNAAQVTLAWDRNAEQNIEGYKVYYGTASRDYDWFIDVGEVTTITITDLADGFTYYFAATAYDNSNPPLESTYSEEVSKNTCSYSISPTSANFPASGGTGSVAVTTQAGCPWTASSGATWMTIASGSSGTGHGTVNYSIASNTGGDPRASSSTIAGRVFTVTQSGATTYTITASAGAGGSISPSGSVSVAQGANQSFTITASTGYHISNVTVDGVSLGSISSYTFNNVTAAHTINATFLAISNTITASAGTGGSITPSGSVSVNFGTNRTFTITPNTGYGVTNVLVDGAPLGAVSSYTFNNVTANHTISASFAVNTFTINASAGVGGSISPSGAVPVSGGANQTFTITPNTGYVILNVVVDGSSVGSVSSYTFTNVSSSHTISASFLESTAFSIWGGVDVVPTHVGSTSAVELGVKFRADADGYIAGIRFYKTSLNTGTHTGTLWAREGTNLGSATFTGETASGWQQANFATPIPITANTTYVASYHAPDGGYAISRPYFTSAGVDNPPLHALQSGVDGLNGVYCYGATSCFPSSSCNYSNYWVDVVFVYTPEPVAPVISSVPVTQAMVDQTYAFDVHATGHPTPTYTLTKYPAGMTINGSTGQIQWTPPEAGSFGVTVEAHNEAGSDTQSFTIEVAVEGYTLMVTTTGGGTGDVTTTPSGTIFPPGTKVTLRAAKDVSSTFEGFSGDCTSSRTSCTITMDKHAAVTAEFKLKTLKVKTTAVGNGTVLLEEPISIEGGKKTTNDKKVKQIKRSKHEAKVDYGNQLVYSIVPEPGSYIKKVVVDGKSQGSFEALTFANIKRNHKVKVIFESETRNGSYENSKLVKHQILLQDNDEQDELHTLHDLSADDDENLIQPPSANHYASVTR